MAATVRSLPSRRAAALVLAGLGLLAAVPSPVAAAVRGPGENAPLDLPAAQPSAGHAATGSGSGLVRTFVGLAIVIAVIYGLYWVLKQVKASREGRPSGSGLEAVASVPLGSSSSLHLVRAGQELVLVGVAERGVVPIRTYDEDAARAAGLLDEPSEELAVASGVPSPARLGRSAAALAVSRSPRRGGSAAPAAANLLQALRRATVR